MTRRIKKPLPPAVTWLSQRIVDPKCPSSSFQHYTKFQFQNFTAEVGDYVLVSNADAAEPDTEDGCDAAKIVSLYEDSTNQNDPFRAKVQWYSKPIDLPHWCFTHTDPVDFLKKEVIEDHRPFNTDVSIETFFKKCSISFTYTKDTNHPVEGPYDYICRYRLISLSKRKAFIEPVIEEERKAIQLLCTPHKNSISQKSAKTPTSLVKRMGRVSLSEQKNWSVSKTDGTKLLLKRAILTDKTEKDCPNKTTLRTPKTSISEISKSAKKDQRKDLDDILSMELKKTSDDELPTLIIRQPIINLQRTITPSSQTPKSGKKEPRKNEEDILSNKLKENCNIQPGSRQRRKSGVRSPKTSVSETTNSAKKDPKKTLEDILSMELNNDSDDELPSSRQRKKSIVRTPPKSVSNTPRSSKKESRKNLAEMLNWQLEENSDNEPNTLIIREHVQTTPKRKQSTSKTNEETPKKALVFEDEENNLYTTRSRRITKNKINYVEEEVSPLKRTTRRTRKVTESDEDFKPAPKVPVVQDMDLDSPVRRTPRRTRKVSESDSEFKPLPKTPRTPRTPKTPAQTPKQRVSRKIISQMTPSLHERTHAVNNNDVLVKYSKSLPGREREMEEILSFVRTKLLDGISGCMYISGLPGTGKTATVCSCLQILKDEVDLPDFQLVEVNGMRVTEPRQAYVHIYKQLTGKTVVWEQACSLLEKRFTNPGPRRTPTVLLVDELDALCTRRQDVLYSIMEWAAHNTALLTVLAVANTMDLPERALAARVASRLGLTRLTFPPYTHTQLQKIVETRLAGARLTPDGLQYAARKVAAVSGDARRALALCARALELAGPGGAGIPEVERALREATTGAAVTVIRRCSPAERLMLLAVATEVGRTGTDETTLSRALATAAALVVLEGRPYRSAANIRAPTPSQALAICSRLAALSLLLLEPKPAEPRLLLNVSVDEVHYATNKA